MCVWVSGREALKRTSDENLYLYPKERRAAADYLSDSFSITEMRPEKISAQTPN